MDKPAPVRCAERPAARQRLRPDAEISGGEVSFEPPSRFTSLDHLVGDLLQMQWHVDIKCLGGLDIDDEFELCGLLDRQGGGPFAPEKPNGVDTRLSLRILQTRS